MEKDITSTKKRIFSLMRFMKMARYFSKMKSILEEVMKINFRLLISINKGLILRT